MHNVKKSLELPVHVIFLLFLASNFGFAIEKRFVPEDTLYGAPQYALTSSNCEHTILQVGHAKYRNRRRRVAPDFRFLYDALIESVDSLPSHIENLYSIHRPLTVGQALKVVFEDRKKILMLLRRYANQRGFPKRYAGAIQTAFKNLQLPVDLAITFKDLIQRYNNLKFEDLNTLHPNDLRKLSQYYQTFSGNIRGYASELIVALQMPHLHRLSFTLGSLLTELKGPNFSTEFCEVYEFDCNLLINKEIDLWLKESEHIVVGEVKNSQTSYVAHRPGHHAHQLRLLNQAIQLVELLDALSESLGRKFILRYYFIGPGVNLFLAQQLEAIGAEVAR